MKKAVLVLLVVLFCGTCYSADRFDGYRRKVADECRAVLEENLRALTEENIDNLLATMSAAGVSKAHQADFRREAEQLFADTDMYVRLDGFELYWIEPAKGLAMATVNQLTLPKDEADHTATAGGKLNFRSRSALLPEYQLVQYKQQFHLVNGKWKVHLVLSEPIPDSSPEFKKLSATGIIAPPAPARQNCPDGKCGVPFVTVRVR
jgi:hypothetical protein